MEAYFLFSCICYPMKGEFTAADDDAYFTIDSAEWFLLAQLHRIMQLHFLHPWRYSVKGKFAFAADDVNCIIIFAECVENCMNDFSWQKFNKITQPHFLLPCISLALFSKKWVCHHCQWCYLAIKLSGCSGTHSNDLFWCNSAGSCMCTS